MFMVRTSQILFKAWLCRRIAFLYCDWPWVKSSLWAVFEKFYRKIVCTSYSNRKFFDLLLWAGFCEVSRHESFACLFVAANWLIHCMPITLWVFLLLKYHWKREEVKCAPPTRMIQFQWFWYLLRGWGMVFEPARMPPSYSSAVAGGHCTRETLRPRVLHWKVPGWVGVAVGVGGGISMENLSKGLDGNIGCFQFLKMFFGWFLGFVENDHVL